MLLTPPYAIPHAQTVYDDVEIEDMTFNAATDSYTYECPCGDLFEITLAELRDGEEIAHCPSCSLVVRVIYDADEFAKHDATTAPATLPALVPKHDD